MWCKCAWLYGIAAQLWYTKCFFQPSNILFCSWGCLSLHVLHLFFYFFLGIYELFSFHCWFDIDICFCIRECVYVYMNTYYLIMFLFTSSFSLLYLFLSILAEKEIKVFRKLKYLFFSSYSREIVYLH